MKNTIMSSLDKFIIFVGRTFSGRHHDYTLLKEELPPQLAWFTALDLWVDLGYLGIQTDYDAQQIEIPIRKPRKSKKNPDPHLSDAHKATNQAVSQVRIFVEHAIGGIKRYNILVHRFRNHKVDFVDEVIAICAALWNFSLSY